MSLSSAFYLGILTICFTWPSSPGVDLHFPVHLLHDALVDGVQVDAAAVRLIPRPSAFIG